jgi:glyoxylase-like metal-dependent hydrolase (beta-lactamase superfamily II)
VAGAAILAMSIAGSLGAAAPPVKTQAPAYYRMMLGNFEVTALGDGTLDLKVTELLTNTTAERVQQALERSFLRDPLETSVNGFLINTGTKLVLIDSGAGSFFGPTLGSLVVNLKASGYQPEQVDEVYITHMHGDHVGGLVSAEQMTFPNATVRVDQHDADYWLSQPNMDAAPEEAKGGFKGAMAATKPYRAADRFKPFEGDTELVPGIRAVAAHGHTPGHAVYLVESQGQKLMLWGDLMHVAAVQFGEPSVTIRFDSDSKAAAARRARLYAEAAQQGYWVAAAHLPFPGIGHVRAHGSGYEWFPANYTIPR